ncbi:flagellar motor stator protein MotA [Salaquimonas pukyongi]|uniref:flagellar motor stator protein MotA n=1 Tax=Salaquimonas pukyongi TaxID=2712698 RepID=UPI00096BB6F2|nr:flagellar motor stator protein MotA [Salaquimonas pukyongi]
MTIIIGLVVVFGCLLGGFAAMGGKLGVLMQPWEYFIIGGVAVGTFIVANPMATIKDTGKATVEAFKAKAPKNSDYLSIIGLLFVLMQEVRSKTRAEIEAHIDDPESSSVFTQFPDILEDTDLLSFITDYLRLIILGNARPHEIEALMEEEIATISRDKLKPYQAVQAVADGLPAIGIVAAVLGVIKAMGSLDKPPEYLGAMIGAALVGTFAGILMSYGLAGPIATSIKVVREKQNRRFVVVKQTLIAFMNGATPHLAVEYGRKTVSSKDRPTLEMVEEQMLNAPVPMAAE